MLRSDTKTFKNRSHAGMSLSRKLTQQLSGFTDVPVLGQVVVGLPRGGVPVAKEVALQLHAPLSILVSKKIGAPEHPELAIGAVSSTGVVILNDELVSQLHEHENYLENKIITLTEETAELEHEWLSCAGIVEPLSLAGKRVILVDDGIATGMTAEAALKSAVQLGAIQTVLATPVIARDTKDKLQKECDLLVAVMEPHQFWAVGQFYDDFHQVDDQEVIEALQDADFAGSRIN